MSRRTSGHPTLIACGAIIVLALGVGDVSWAQSTPVSAANARTDIRVQVLDQLSALPLEGTLVSLLASDGRTVAEGLTDTGGFRALEAPSAGSYRVRVRRIGFVPFTSDPVRLDAGTTTPLALRIPSIPVRLATVTTTAKTKDCGRIDAAQSASSELWEQIRIALETSELTRIDTSVITLLRSSEVVLSTGGDLRGINSVSQSVGINRYVAPRSASDLSRRGYLAIAGVNEMEYYGPDASVLLSPEFENDHCFAMVTGTGPTAGLVGLSFAPVSGRQAPDITGVLWVNASNDRLEYVDYRYVNPPLVVRGAPLMGGRIIFERLPTGEWIIQDWVIRTPKFSGNGSSVTGYTAFGGSVEPVTMNPSPRGAGTCPNATAPLTVGVTDRADLSPVPRPRGVAGVPPDSELRAVFEVDWFDSVATSRAWRAIGPPEVAQGRAPRSVVMCVLPHDGEAVVRASVGRASSTSVYRAHAQQPYATTFYFSRDDLSGRAARALPPPHGSSGIDMVVRDSAGAPLEGATLVVDGWHYTSAATDRFGHLALSDLPSTTVILDIWRPGYARQRLAVDLEPKKTQAIEVRLGPETGPR